MDLWQRICFIQLILVEWQKCREKRAPLEGTSVLGQWPWRVTCAPGAGLYHQGEQTHIQGSPLPLFYERKIRLNRDHPLSQLPWKTRKQTPTCVFIQLLICTAHTAQGTPGARVQTSRVVLHRAPWWCERFRPPAPLPLLCWMLPVIHVFLLSWQSCCYGEKSQALNIELPVISAGICRVQVSAGVYLNK